jgi:nitronate monooxygenase
MGVGCNFKTMVSPPPPPPNSTVCTTTFRIMSWIKTLRLPVIASPMFLVSGPDLVIASCKAGIVGTFPALNCRTEDQLDTWITQIKRQVDKPFGVNLIVHKTNPRLDHQVATLVQAKVPLIITSLGAVSDIIKEVHSYGGIVLHDVTNEIHAKKAVAAGVDGLIAICGGAGGHAGAISPFALIPRLKSLFDCLIVAGGAISNGQTILASQALGADLAYMGTRFIPTVESMASQPYKELLLRGPKIGPPPFFTPTIYTDKISGIHANFLRESVIRNGMDPDNIVIKKDSGLGNEDWIKEGSEAKAWKDLWSAGQGVMTINSQETQTVEQIVSSLESEYLAARNRISVSTVYASPSRHPK